MVHWKQDNEELIRITVGVRDYVESKLIENPQLLVSGVMINPDSLEYVLEQNTFSDQIKKLPNDFYFDLFRNTSHHLACITQTRPELLPCLKMLLKVTKENFQNEDMKTINGLIMNVRKTRNQNYVTTWH